MAWMQTYSGTRFDFENPTLDMIQFEDIAHSLALQCRYAGHANHHYSIAQHSYYVSFSVPHQVAFEGLMHDAHEAYCQDLVHGMKESIAGYGYFEERMRRLVAAKFDLDPHGPPAVVKEMDKRISLNELDYLFDDHRDDYTLERLGYEPIDHLVMTPWDPRGAEIRFRSRFIDLRD